MVLLSITSFFGDAGATWMASWLPLTILAVIGAMILHTVLWIVGKSFSIRELEMFAMSEMLQTASTAFMAIFLVVMVGSTMEIARNFISGDVYCGSTPIHIGTTAESTMDEAFNAIRCRLQERAKAVADIQDSIVNSGWTSAKFNLINMAGSMFGLTFIKGEWFSDLYRDTETIRITNNFATVLLIGLNAQGALLQYIQINMLHIFVPVGILMRSFYFTRGPGALFIAVGIGMYFVFPIFFVLLDPGFVPSPPPPPAEIPVPTNFCYATMTNAVSVLTAMETAGFGSSESLTLSSVRDELSKSYISLILHPLIAFFMTLIFIRYMMSILGGDTYELTKMVSKVI